MWNNEGSLRKNWCSKSLLHIVRKSDSLIKDSTRSPKLLPREDPTTEREPEHNCPCSSGSRAEGHDLLLLPLYMQAQTQANSVLWSLLLCLPVVLLRIPKARVSQGKKLDTERSVNQDIAVLQGAYFAISSPGVCPVHVCPFVNLASWFPHCWYRLSPTICKENAGDTDPLTSRPREKGLVSSRFPCSLALSHFFLSVEGPSHAPGDTPPDFTFQVRSRLPQPLSSWSSIDVSIVCQNTQGEQTHW